MELKDFVVTPIVLLLVLFGAYFIRPYVTDNHTKKYFFPALVLKILGAISVGLIYQFYYERGGDTFAYYQQAEVLYNAFFEDPVAAIKLIFDGGGNYYSSRLVYDPDTYSYASQMRFYGGMSEYFLVKITAIFGLLSFHTYTSMAIIFAVVSFSGLWTMFLALYRRYPKIHLQLAFAIFFLPSVVFWGSGIMKDTLVMAAIGWAFWGVSETIYYSKVSAFRVVLILVSLYIIYVIKIYVLFSFIPSIMLWVLLEYKNKIKNKLIRWTITPAFMTMAILIGYFIIASISEGDKRYDLENIGERTKINAEYLYYVSVKNEGSGYYLGELDGSLQSMIRLAPAAINVTLFRPYLWEVQNPLMLLSFLESTLFLVATLSLFFVPGIPKMLRIIYKNPLIIFCFLFSIVLAVGVGLNSFNFGTLVRYKIPLLPFYLSAIFILRYLAKEKILKNNELVETNGLF